MKNRHDIIIDDFLWQILTQETCHTKKSRSDLITEIICEKYGIKLNPDMSISEDTKKEYQIHCIDNKILELKEKKKTLQGGESV